MKKMLMAALLATGALHAQAIQTTYAYWSADEALNLRGTLTFDDLGLGFGYRLNSGTNYDPSFLSHFPQSYPFGAGSLTGVYTSFSFADGRLTSLYVCNDALSLCSTASAYAWGYKQFGVNIGSDGEGQGRYESVAWNLDIDCVPVGSRLPVSCQAVQQSQIFVSAVPEPETYALMALGLATLGIARRRAKG